MESVLSNTQNFQFGQLSNLEVIGKVYLTAAVIHEEQYVAHEIICWIF
jgi:hypothetical protein